MHRDARLTELLAGAGRGDAAAGEQLLCLVYDDLRAMAARLLKREAAAGRRDPTSLVHDAYLRLFGQGPAAFANRKHFFKAAKDAMRRICIDYARIRGSLKRGGDRRRAPLPEEIEALADDPETLVAVDEALKKLDQEAPRQAEVVFLRYFAGLSVDETAREMNVSPRTVDNYLQLARAWLAREWSAE